MRTRRLIAALSVPALLLVGCSSHKAVVPTVSTTSSSAQPTSAAPSTTVVSKPPAKPKPKPVPKPKPARPGAKTDPLTGTALSLNPVIAVKIDNTFFDVPQFGVSEADVVYVEQVEGGLTRLIAVFHTSIPNEVGPVRSVRSTDSELLTVFGRPLLVFSGGADGPLSMLARTPIINASGMDGVYWRSDVAYGTYNLHADLTKVAAQGKGLGATAPGPVGFTFAAADPRVAAGPKATHLQVVMQAGETDFTFSGGHYVRYRDGVALSDYQGRVEAADNVLVQSVADEPDGTVDTNGQPSLLSHTVGSGAVTLYRDGHAIKGTWKRPAAGKPFAFVDQHGKPLPFKPGRTWIMLAPANAQVSVS